MTIDKRNANQTLPDDVIERLVNAAAPVMPAPDRAAAVKSALMERVRADRNRFVTVRADEGAWVKIAPLVDLKVLHDDGHARSFLLRLAPGARLPAHTHVGEEACVVLEGTAALGDLEVRAGDFHLAAAGSAHGDITSRTGALLYLRADAPSLSR